MKITKSKSWYWKAHILTGLVAWVFCIVPTLVTGLIKLPVIVTEDATSTLTGTFTLCLVLCAYPLLKGALRLLKSPSAWLIMWLMTGMLYLIYNVSHETLGALLTVFFVGAIGNSIGAVLFFFSRRYKEKWAFSGGKV